MRDTERYRNPFNDSLLASGSDDGKVFLWRVPENFTLHPDVKPDEIEDVAPVGKLSGHPRWEEQFQSLNTH